jgi:hypothetical protein
VYPGGPSPFLLGPAHARPRSRTPALSPRPLTGQPRLSAAPPPDTVSRLTRQLSLPCSVRSALARVAHVARERRARAAAGRRPPVRARPHGTPALRGTPMPGTPTFSLPFPLCRAAAEPLTPRSRCSTPLGPLLSSAQASPLLPAPRLPPPAIGSPLSLVDSSRAPPSSATPR